MTQIATYDYKLTDDSHIETPLDASALDKYLERYQLEVISGQPFETKGFVYWLSLQLQSPLYILQFEYDGDKKVYTKTDYV